MRMPPLRMPMTVLVASLLIAMSLATALAGESQERSVGALLPPSVPGPMTIAADRMTIHEAEQRATFDGRVVVRQGDLTVKADRLDVWATGSVAGLGPAYGSGTISSIKATGHVEVIHGERSARADAATYDQARQQIELAGNLVGEEGGYKVAGTRMVIYLQERRSVVEGSRVIIPPGFMSAGPNASDEGRTGPLRPTVR